MSHQDKCTAGVRFNYEYLRLAVTWLFRTAELSPLVLRGDCTWSAASLACVALLWAWADEFTLGERFATARKIVQYLFPVQREPAGSYQAFTKILRRWTREFVPLLQAAFRGRAIVALPGRWLLHGYAVFGSDGSRIELPRTRSNEAAYAASARRKKRRCKKRRRKHRRSTDRAAEKKAGSPQFWLTTLWHAATGLPWDWRLGPVGSSEREHLQEMLAALPQNALVTADAGFVGYDFLKNIHDSGRKFVVRVGSNVALLRKLGCARESEGLVYLWPDHAARSDRPPLVLRLVEAQGPKHTVYIVTNALATRELTDRQVCDVYRMRWGIELFYRHLKQTYQRRKLRSATAENARLELEWSLLGLWAMALYAQVELAGQQVAANKVSIAGVLRAFRRMLRDYLHPAAAASSLCEQIRRAVIDGYVRASKSSRTDIRRKYDKPPGPPTITNATRKQIRHARRLNAPSKKCTPSKKG